MRNDILIFVMKGWTIYNLYQVIIYNEMKDGLIIKENSDKKHRINGPAVECSNGHKS